MVWLDDLDNQFYDAFRCIKDAALLALFHGEVAEEVFVDLAEGVTRQVDWGERAWAHWLVRQARAPVTSESRKMSPKRCPLGNACIIFVASFASKMPLFAALSLFNLRTPFGFSKGFTSAGPVSFVQWPMPKGCVGDLSAFQWSPEKGPVALVAMSALAGSRP